MQRKTIGALLVVLAAVIAACGESEPLSQAEFRTQANAVCAELSRQARALSDGSPEQRYARAADILEDGIEQLEEIEPPDRLAGRYRAFLTWKEAQQDAVRALAEPDGKLSARGMRAMRLHGPLEKLADELGLRGCE
jgi:hypothetical protein